MAHKIQRFCFTKFIGSVIQSTKVLLYKVQRFCYTKYKGSVYNAGWWLGPPNQRYIGSTVYMWAFTPTFCTITASQLVGAWLLATGADVGDVYAGNARRPPGLHGRLASLSRGFRDFLAGKRCTCRCWFI